MSVWGAYVAILNQPEAVTQARNCIHEDHPFSLYQRLLSKRTCNESRKVQRKFQIIDKALHQSRPESVRDSPSPPLVLYALCDIQLEEVILGTDQNCLSCLCCKSNPFRQQAHFFQQITSATAERNYMKRAWKAYRRRSSASRFNCSCLCSRACSSLSFCIRCISACLATSAAWTSCLR